MLPTGLGFASNRMRVPIPKRSQTCSNHGLPRLLNHGMQVRVSVAETFIGSTRKPGLKRTAGAL